MNTCSVTVLDALKNALDKNTIEMPKVVNHVNLNRINSSGDLLEYYVKDIFCNEASYYEDTKKKLDKYQQVFSYLGNANNPPDFIVKRGVAVEVKKIEGVNPNGIALNSSYPKDYLYSDDYRIKKACRECEDEYGGWDKKDMIYAIGNVVNHKLHSLWLIYGDCYCADKSSYERVSKTIKEGVSSIPGVEFSETKELARVNKVDPLGITYLRVRGMWGIEHPSSVFNYLLNEDEFKTNIYVLLRKETYDSIKNKPDFSDYINAGTLIKKEVKIPDPNNPAKNMNAVLLNGMLG